MPISGWRAKIDVGAMMMRIVAMTWVAMLAACGPTQGGECTLCGDLCVDVEMDPSHCGACDNACPAGACFAGECVAASPQCTDPGATESCYNGAQGTEGVGPCRAGQRTCGDNGLWGPCQGEVFPVTEICANTIDDDCDGTPDDDNDDDGDGWGPCGGDCCDVPGPSCADPALVNPGAFDAVGNAVDDDCDGTVDNGLSTCDSGLASNSADPLDYARAIDLCQTTAETTGPQDRRWGVISAELVLADGTGVPAAASRSIRPSFGATGVLAGQSMAVLSTGHAAAVGDVNPPYAEFQFGQEMGTASGFPPDWLAANSGVLPNAPGCPPPDATAANNPVMLRLRIRVPTNAQSFSLGSYFYSAEYPEWVCSPFNDFFVALLSSSFTGQPANPADGNLAIYTAPNLSQYPVGVNLAHGNTGLFTQCENGSTGCEQQSVAGSTAACTSTGDLVGTGFDVVRPPNGCTGCLGWCGTNDLAGGGTGWLVTSGNVVPGEIMELRLAIWDTSDQAFDSLVLLDDFQWSLDVSDPGTEIVVD